jgi:hypothetical protein
MARIFIRDDEQLTCEIRPSEDGGYEIVWTQDGENHIENFPLESEARARSTSVEEDLIQDGWSIAS